MPNDRAEFDPLKVYLLNWDATESVDVTLTRVSDRETRTVKLSEALRAVGEGAWTVPGSTFRSARTVEIQGVESGVEGPGLALELLWEFAQADEQRREVLVYGGWYHVMRTGLDYPSDSHDFFITVGTEPKLTVTLTDEHGSAFRLADLLQPYTPDISDRFSFARSLVARDRFESETELGRLARADRRLTDLEHLGFRPGVDTLALQRELLAAKRNAGLASHLRRITWLLLLLLGVSIWIALKPE